MINKEEQKTIDNIKATPYMQKTVALIDSFVKEHICKNKTTVYLLAFDEMFRILNEAKPFVDEYLIERKRKGEIKDEKQALKSIAGNSFTQALVYLFLKNKEIGNIRTDIFITSQITKVPSFKEIAVINVDGETQKPDCDLVIFSLNEDSTMNKCMILSLKTSLRERAGQTYKWKLLMEIATTDNPMKEKYKIQYNPEKIPLIAFATVNFYDQINKPQFRGMLKFFDKSFIADKIDSDFIVRMSVLPNYVNEKL